MNYENGKAMLVRRLIAQHAASRGFPAYGNEATSALFFEWLAVPPERRPSSFHDYIIQTLGDKGP